MEESVKTKSLFIQFPINVIFTKELYTEIINNFYKTNPDEIVYKIFIATNGIIDKNKLIKKLEEEFDKNIENQLEEISSIDKEDLINIIKELNREKILFLENEKKELEKSSFIVITREYDIDKNKTPLENALKSSYNLYEEFIKPILIFH